MAIVRVLVAMSGQQSWAAGDLYECDEAAAERLIAAGRAERVSPVVPPAVVAPETAMLEGGPERAVKPRPKARGLR